MATNLFEAFDRAFAEPRPSLAAGIVAAARRRIDGLLARRRGSRDVRRVAQMPPHLLEDIGLVARHGRLWPTA
ncbi:MAG TPA: hypothetical protein PKA09_23185, partial [Geminicoccus sp.]|nr:hypothetical protein [Geminicoccus sp.]